MNDCRDYAYVHQCVPVQSGFVADLILLWSIFVVLSRCVCVYRLFVFVHVYVYVVFVFACARVFLCVCSCVPLFVMLCLECSLRLLCYFLCPDYVRACMRLCTLNLVVFSILSLLFPFCSSFRSPLFRSLSLAASIALSACTFVDMLCCMCVPCTLRSFLCACRLRV